MLVDRWKVPELAPTCVRSGRLKEGKKTVALASILPLEKVLQISAPLVHILKLINKSPSCITQVLFKLLLLFWVSDQSM